MTKLQDDVAFGEVVIEIKERLNNSAVALNVLYNNVGMYQALLEEATQLHDQLQAISRDVWAEGIDGSQAQEAALYAVADRVHVQLLNTAAEWQLIVFSRKNRLDLYNELQKLIDTLRRSADEPEEN